jgi:hypothetical protein
MPADVQYEGFRDLARLRRLRYLRAHRTVVPAGADWHSSDISLGEEGLEDAIAAAIDLVTMQMRSETRELESLVNLVGG